MAAYQPQITSNPDVLNGILGCLYPHDLQNVCLVDRRLRGAAEPLLYVSIQWRCCAVTEFSPFSLPLRTVLWRPDLGDRTREVSLLWRSPWFTWWKRITPHIPVDEHVIRAASDAVRQYHIAESKEEIWLQGLSAGEVDALYRCAVVATA